MKKIYEKPEFNITSFEARENVTTLSTITAQYEYTNATAKATNVITF